MKYIVVPEHNSRALPEIMTATTPSGMREAYVFQVINFLVSISTVPVLLHYLDAYEYVTWTVFTTFGAASLQVQNAIQPVSIREVARAFQSQDQVALASALKSTSFAYSGLALFMLVVAAPGGLAYLNAITQNDVSISIGSAWVIFALSYSLNYAFATNSAVLLGMFGVARQNNINSATRVLYFGLTLAFLRSGYSILGMSASFALAVGVGVSLSTLSAKRHLRRFRISLALKSPPTWSPRVIHLQFIERYAIYTVSSFLIYNGMLLMAALHFSKSSVASYGLSLQASTLLSAFALTPLQVWLADFVKAAIRDDRRRVVAQLAQSIFACNAIYLLGAGSFDVFGGDLLHLLGSRIALPPTSILVGTSVAFLVELNIALLVNVLSIRRNYRFTLIYGVTALFAVLCATLMIHLSGGIFGALICIPLAVQAMVCLPLVLREVAKDLGLSSVDLLGEICRVAWSAASP